jgi:hypothetical protein
MFRCWICGNDTEFPFQFGSHGRAYCSAYCAKFSQQGVTGVPRTHPCPPDEPHAVAKAIPAGGVHVEAREGHP